ncbi:MAG: ATP-binding protein [Candidatus Eremiobacterota bacterium]
MVTVATAEQLKALVRSFAAQDDEQFYRVALQVAAHEARMGHDRLARELKEMVDKARANRQLPPRSQLIPIARPRGELQDLISLQYSDLRLAQMVLSEATRDSLQRLLDEQRKEPELARYGLRPRRKLLLAGPPGTGKSMSARALAGELDWPLFLVRFESLITKYMGETASKMRLIFQAMNDVRGIYLFDEFDTIGAQRALPNEVGEIRRVVNSFLQLLEEDQSASLIIAATNHPGLLDRALFRRFDDMIWFELPTPPLVEETLRQRLARFPLEEVDFSVLAEAGQGMNFADLISACEDAAKFAVLENRFPLTTGDLREAIARRRSARNQPPSEA